MANKIKQYRYYNDGTPLDNVTKNQPMALKVNGEEVKVTYQHFVSGEVFQSNFPVLQLGVQALPGTKFYLNNAIEPIIIGSTGIYELDLNGQTEITAIQLDKNSMVHIRDNDNAYLIIDVIYDDGEE